jgi:formimidoylglutamate deiminase
VPAAVAQAGVPHGSREGGWLPDCVYTGEKFETGLAFFADATGRITRFSREPGDLAAARRLAGQAALPGLVNTHSRSFQRVLRGRTEQRGRPGEPLAGWTAALGHATGRATSEEVFDAARMVFMEMLLAGITCVGEYHLVTPAAPEPNHLRRELLRAAHEVGIRIALFNVAPERAEPFLRDVENFRTAVEKEFSADEVWLGIGVDLPAVLPVDAIKAVATYARAQRLRLHAHVAPRPGETLPAGRSPLAQLAELGFLDKRFTALHPLQLTDDDVKLLGAARATVCALPITALNLGLGSVPVEKLIAAGAGLALGSDGHTQIDLLKEARMLEYQLRVQQGQRAVSAADPATALFHAVTVTGARSLGATGGALEVGRPADFFTVNLFDPSIAGAEPGALLANVVFALERRAIRDVWIGGRQRVTAGRHPLHGPIVGRFVEAQRRIWSA